MSNPFNVVPIGTVISSRAEAVDDNWDAQTTRIELNESILGNDATLGLDSFSHLEVVYLFDQVTNEMINTGSRHPRGNQAWPKIGILSQRGRNRPNRLGVTICQILAVKNLTIQVRGLDAIDGTPVLDIKPVLSGFLPRGEVTEPQWAREIMTEYW